MKTKFNLSTVLLFAFAVVLGVISLALSASRTAAPIDAADGVDIVYNHSVEWLDGSNVVSYLYGYGDGSVLWKFGQNGQQISYDETNKRIKACADANNHCLEVFSDHVNIPGNLYAEYGVYAGADIEATGAVTGSNLSGVNTGDQIITPSILSANLMGATLAPNVITYAAPFTSQTGSILNSRVPIVSAGELKNLSVVTTSTQTGNLQVTVYLNGTSSGLTLTLTGGAGLYSTSGTVSVPANSKMTFQLANGASTSAGISGISVEYYKAP